MHYNLERKAHFDCIEVLHQTDSVFYITLRTKCSLMLKNAHFVRRMRILLWYREHPGNIEFDLF